MEIRSITAGPTTLTYHWTRKPVKNLNLRVRPDGSVHLSTPRRTPARAADDFVRSRLDWIAGARARVEARRPPPDSAPLGEGSAVYYLGRPLTLTLIPGGQAEAAGERLLLPVDNPLDPSRVEKALAAWQKGELERIFRDCSPQFFPLFAGRYIGCEPVLKIRTMKSRWGSCHTAKGIITLNARLLEKPLPAIEYVILHEYAHFAVANHSPDFYRVLAGPMPDYKERRKLLR